MHFLLLLLLLFLFPLKFFFFFCVCVCVRIIQSLTSPKVIPTVTLTFFIFLPELPSQLSRAAAFTVPLEGHPHTSGGYLHTRKKKEKVSTAMLYPTEPELPHEAVASVAATTPPPPSSSSSSHRVSRRSSPTADALLREQQASPAGVSPTKANARIAAAGVNALPSPLRVHHHTPRGTPGKPPLVQHAISTASKGAELEEPLLNIEHPHSAPLPATRNSLHLCSDDNDDGALKKKTVTTVAGGRVLSPGRKQQLQERYKKALGELATEQPSPPHPMDEVKDTAAAARNHSCTATVRGGSLFSYGSVDEARRIRRFYAGSTDGDDDDEEEKGKDNIDDNAARSADQLSDVPHERQETQAEATPHSSGRRRRATHVTAVDTDSIRSFIFLAEGSSSGAGAVEQRSTTAQNDDDDDEVIRRSEASCQTSQRLFQDYLDELADENAESDAAAAACDDAGDNAAAAVARLAGPHYMGTNRWMCALGLCPLCHPTRLSRNTNRSPSRSVKAGTEARAGGPSHTSSSCNAGGGKTAWPIIARSSLGYAAPSQLTRPLTRTHLLSSTPPRHTASISRSSGVSRSRSRNGPQRRAAEPASARLPSTPSTAAAINTTTTTTTGRRDLRDGYLPKATAAYHGVHCFTNERDARQRKLQRQLRDLQREQSGRYGGGRTAYGPRLLTSHDVQAGLPMQEYAYRYCDLASERMMVHHAAGTGRWTQGDMPLADYNDTLDGAPLVSRHTVPTEDSSEVSREQALLGPGGRAGVTAVDAAGGEVGTVGE